MTRELPLRAATAMDAAPGSYYAPDRMFGLKRDPVLAPVPKPGRDEAAARRLWEVAEKLTGCRGLLRNKATPLSRGDMKIDPSYDLLPGSGYFSAFCLEKKGMVKR